MKKVLLVVDYQTDFVVGTLGFEEAKLLDDKISDRIEKAIKNGEYIVYTKDTHYKQYYLNTQEGRRLPIIHTIYNTPGWNLYGKTAESIRKVQSYNPDMICGLMKNTFGELNLNKSISLFGSDIDEIEICGIITNMCVISNAIICKASYPEARIVINAELCASPNKELHEQALNVMESMQMDIINR